MLSSKGNIQMILKRLQLLSLRKTHTNNWYKCYNQVPVMMGKKKRGFDPPQWNLGRLRRGDRTQADFKDSCILISRNEAWRPFQLNTCLSKNVEVRKSREKSQQCPWVGQRLNDARGGAVQNGRTCSSFNIQPITSTYCV